ncbi:MAG: hypothetical protein FJ291_03445 [Planctomycetes bacterium]|nr:hypothetical protein [Planctomycetota bacterium]
MLRATLVVALPAIVLAGEVVKPEVGSPEGRRAFDELAAYYRDKDKRPDYDRALRDLRSADPAVRRSAGGYLLALLKQSDADESNGRAAWEKVPWWGGGYDNAARRFRGSLATAFGEQAQGAEALDAARWLIHDEPLAGNQADGMRALRRIRTPESAEVLKQVLAQPHPNGDVIKGAIEEAGERALKDLAPHILRLCQHYRASIRTAARAAAPKLGVAAVPDFKPEEAFTPWLDDALKKIATMVLDEVPKDARWVHVEYAFGSVDDKPPIHELGGWLLREDDKGYDLLSYFACKCRPEKRDVRKLTPRTLAEEAEDLRKFRQEVGGKDDHDARERLAQRLSAQGIATGQFESRALSLPEALVAAWCYVRGDKKSAAALLFPRLDALESDDWLLPIVRDYLGHRYHQGMLDLFSYARDYEGTLRIARHLAKPLFDGYEYQDRAKELAEQLPKRRDDFKTFVLPNPDEWAKLKTTLTRAQQIEFLAPRLRLLNCHQWSQPGDVHYSDEQDAAPGFRQADGPDAKPVINPYNELKAMDIQPAGLPALVPFLADESYMPTFSYWRNFHPSRTLHRANWIVARLVSDAAMRDLPDLRTYSRLDPAGKKKHIEGILAWCKANAHRTRVELAIELMEKTGEWREFAFGASVAVRAKAPAALPILLRRLTDFPKNRGQIAELCYRLDSRETIGPARQWLHSDEPEQRFWAALILIRHGDKTHPEGLPELKAILDKDDDLFWYTRAFEDLLATRHDGAIRLACSLLDRKELARKDHVTAPLIQRLFLAGRKEGLDCLLKLLDNLEDRYTRSGPEGDLKCSEADSWAQTIAAWRTDKFAYDDGSPPAERARKREELKAWLRRCFEAIQAGRAPDMKQPPLPLFPPRRGEWRLDTP